MCSPVNAAARCRPRASARCSSASAGAPVCPSPSSRTCCGTPAATPWPMRGTTRGRCKHGSATRTSNTRSGTPSWRRIGSRISGDRAPRDPTRFRTIQVYPKERLRKNSLTIPQTNSARGARSGMRMRFSFMKILRRQSLLTWKMYLNCKTCPIAQKMFSVLAMRCRS
jgi:hypothetical protein